MNHLLKLFNDTVVEIQGFNDSQFYIFKDEDRKDLTHMWYHEANRNPNKFMSMLSPDQKDYVSIWTLRKVNTPLDEIIHNLNYTLQEFQSLAERYQGTLTKPHKFKPKTMDEQPKATTQTKAQTKAQAKTQAKTQAKAQAKTQAPPPPYNQVNPLAPPLSYTLEPLVPSPPPNFKDLSKVCSKEYPTLSQVLNDYQPISSEFIDVKKPKGYLKDMKKMEALGDKYNLSFSKKVNQEPLRTRDVSRARLKSGFQSLKNIVLVPNH